MVQLKNSNQPIKMLTLQLHEKFTGSATSSLRILEKNSFTLKNIENWVERSPNKNTSARKTKFILFYFIFSRRRLIRCKTAESSSKYFGGGYYFDGPQSFRYNGDLLYKQANWVTLTLLDYGWRLSSPNLEILVAFVGNTWTRCHTQISTQHFSRVMTLLKSFYTKLAPEMGEELNYFAKNRPTFLRHYKV